MLKGLHREYVMEEGDDRGLSLNNATVIERKKSKLIRYRKRDFGCSGDF